MKITARKNVSFPVVVWYEPETGEIHIRRPTEKGFHTSVSSDPISATGHPRLYRALRQALNEAGVGFAEPPAKYN